MNFILCAIELISLINKNMDNHFVLRIVLIVLAALVLIALVNHYQTKQSTKSSEKFYDDVKQAASYGPQSPSAMPIYADENVMKADAVNPSKEMNNETYRSVDFNSQALPNDCFPKDRLTADDLLPHDAANSTWSQVNPAGQGDVQGQNFLTAGFNVGINTVGSTMRNANLQVRSEPPNPQIAVGPFNNSTITPDLLRSPFTINGSCGEY